MTKLGQHLNLNSQLGLVVQAALVPDGSTVSKKTGSKPYTLRHTLKVYRDSSVGGPTPFEMQGCFLLSDGSVDQINPSTELLWRVSVAELHDILDYIVDPPENK